MRKIVYCTTCKGRLWQLKKTLPINLHHTGEHVQIVLLDYHSNDNMESYVKENYHQYLTEERLQYFKVITDINGFDMAFAKHIVHLIAQGEVLFNLDADNYIGNTVSELRTLPDNTILLPIMVKDTQTSRCGRIGIARRDYLKYGGYNITIRNMANDDGEFIKQMRHMDMRVRYSNDKSVPIYQNDVIKFENAKRQPAPLPKVVVLQNHTGDQFSIDTIDNTITRTL